jgi:mannosyltransferase
VTDTPQTGIQSRLDRTPDSLWLTGILLVGFAVRLYHLGEQSLWFDEAYSWLNIAATDLWTAIKLELADFVQPSLYYALCRPFTLLGDHEWVLRLPSALAGTLTLPVIYVLGKQFGGRRVGLSAAALLALNPFHVWFSREARTYALTMLFTLLTLHFFLQAVRGRRSWTWFTLFSGLGFITHYFCLLLPLVQFVYLLLNFRQKYPIFRRWVLSMALAFLPMLAWAIALFTQEERTMGIGWIPMPGPWEPLLTLWNWSLVTVGPWTALETVALPVFALALALGQGRSAHRQLLIPWLAVPPTAAMLISWMVGRSFYVDRYLIISLTPYLLLLALGTWRPPKRWAKIGLMAALLAVSAAGTMRLFTHPLLAKQDWRTAMAILASDRRPGDVVVLRNANDIVPATYYERDLSPWTYLEPRAEDDSWLSSVAEFDAQRLWLIYLDPTGSNHLLTRGQPFEIRDSADEATRTWLADHQGQIVADHALPGIGMMLIALPP